MLTMHHGWMFVAHALQSDRGSETFSSIDPEEMKSPEGTLTNINTCVGVQRHSENLL